MKLNTQNFLAQGWPVKLALWLGKFLPKWGARPFAAVGAWLVMLIKPDVYHGARANQRHVLGPDVPEKELRKTLRRLFFNTLRRYYELFYNMGRGHTRAENFDPPIRLTEQSKVHLQKAVESGRGIFFIACHMANFDLVGITMVQTVPLPMLVLSLATPSRDMEIINELRKRCGATLTPITPESLRDAFEWLRRGETVATGVEYPLPEGQEEPVTFFGAPANLASGYMRIPLRTDSLVVTLAAHYENGVYWIHLNPPLEMEHTGDRKKDVEVNLRRVLEQIEDFIRQHPDEWMMYLPVWRKA